MNRCNHAPESPFRRRGPRGDPFDRWVERTRAYLRGRTADHWLMFAGGLVLGALLG
jgi:hypothetical protein